MGYIVEKVDEWYEGRSTYDDRQRLLKMVANCVIAGIMDTEVTKEAIELGKESRYDITPPSGDADTRIQQALGVLNMIKTEIPKTMGETNLQLLHQDVCKAIDLLNGVNK